MNNKLSIIFIYLTTILLVTNGCKPENDGSEALQANFNSSNSSLMTRTEFLEESFRKGSAGNKELTMAAAGVGIIFVVGTATAINEIKLELVECTERPQPHFCKSPIGVRTMEAMAFSINQVLKALPLDRIQSTLSQKVSELNSLLAQLPQHGGQAFQALREFLTTKMWNIFNSQSSSVFYYNIGTSSSPDLIPIDLGPVTVDGQQYQPFGLSPEVLKTIWDAPGDYSPGSVTTGHEGVDYAILSIREFIKTIKKGENRRYRKKPGCYHASVDGQHLHESSHEGLDLWIGAHKFDHMGGWFGAFSMAYMKAFGHCVLDHAHNPASRLHVIASGSNALAAFLLSGVPHTGASFTFHDLFTFSGNWAKQLSNLPPDTRNALFEICTVYPVDEWRNIVANRRSNVRFYEHPLCVSPKETNISKLQ